jgi:putative ABC transport system substrate-binding protein
MQFDQLRRREFMTLLGAATAWPFAAWAQQAKAANIGLLGTASAAAQSQWTAAFVQRMRELGWVEGRTDARDSRRRGICEGTR